ncbi:50S ribosomal protein L22 [Candidatus Wolfebacteria bacterium CG1_02_39_135]|uniref:Large ribosomal subunit protein uL22 n=1 Tax=Candidatus Wolfebacteria bacterium CG1_02_39_135 TaxID=1805425 RepID=A0A1J4Y3Y6_9BACT|nr:50S ribosomal protein L22 [Parcubacteria group bacterium]NCO89405.1 50S ribosomal protein L22 [Candidatus Wolfebacteria bacterium]NCP58492.1 50S ribosomal protein L22 [Candidatus Wolfebacteria bacterium]NCQ02441.1 50S ribosomal protein L22 [Candidatus Wolfebacteria bacterium]OIO65477.1 MAG: 50S ribosomal protein L22 [Candidatus Wolfebacteria bacterium CG1_02_39_135]
MKIQTTKLRYLRMAPRKVRLVANFVKGLSVNEAEAQLLMNPRRPSSVLLKLLRSAVANAKHNSQLSPERLFIKEIRVDQGPMLKRYMPRAMGRASHIQKKSSHIILVLAESEKLRTPRFKITKPERVSKKEKIEKSRRMKQEEEIKKPKAPEEKERQKPAGKPSFIKRIFRRKSI